MLKIWLINVIHIIVPERICFALLNNIKEKNISTIYVSEQKDFFQ